MELDAVAYAIEGEALSSWVESLPLLQLEHDLVLGQGSGPI